MTTTPAAGTATAELLQMPAAATATSRLGAGGVEAAVEPGAVDADTGAVAREGLGA